MILFLVFLIPLSLAIVLINYSRNGQAVTLPVMPFFQGMFMFIPSFLLLTIIHGVIEPSYSGAGFFFYTFFRDHAIMLLFSIGWLVLFRNSLLLNPREKILYTLMAFLGGYYSMVNIHEYLTRITHLDIYALFLLPVINLSLVILMALFLTHIVREYGLVRYISLVGLVSLPFAMTTISVLFFRNFPVPSIIGTVCLGAVAAILLFFRREAVV